MLLEANAAPLARFPTFRAWLDRCAPSESAIERSPHGEAGTLVVDGIHLGSALDPRGEARLQATQIPEGASEAWLFGLGAGVLPDALLARRELARLHVVGLSARATLALLSHDVLPWLADPRVTMHAPDEVTTLPTPRAIAPADLRLAEIHPLRDALLFELARDAQDAWLAERKAQRTARGRANRARFASDGDVATLFGTAGALAKRGFVIAAAGPSLTDSLARIAPHRDAYFVIAVSTALVPLERAGIVPDVVVMIDAHPALLRHLEVLERLDALRDVPLVYAIDLYPEVIERWPGPRYAAHLALPGFEELAREISLGTLFCSGTVTHSAVDLAVRMGASDVILFGADFGYPEGRTHAEGAAFTKSLSGARVPVENVRGELIATDVNLLGYLRDLEMYLARTRGVRVWNASRNGARIAGTSAWEGPAREGER